MKIEENAYHEDAAGTYSTWTYGRDDLWPGRALHGRIAWFDDDTVAYSKNSGIHTFRQHSQKLLLAKVHVVENSVNRSTIHRMATLIRCHYNFEAKNSIEWDKHDIDAKRVFLPCIITTSFSNVNESIPMRIRVKDEMQPPCVKRETAPRNYCYPFLVRQHAFNERGYSFEHFFSAFYDSRMRFSVVILSILVCAVAYGISLLPFTFWQWIEILAGFFLFISVLLPYFAAWIINFIFRKKERFSLSCEKLSLFGLYAKNLVFQMNVKSFQICITLVM